MIEECVLQKFLQDHPEIKRVRLIYTWDFFACVILDDYTATLIDGRRFDPEYCYIGTREGAIKYLDSYGSTWSMYDEMDLWRAYNSKTGELYLRYDAEDYEDSPILYEVPQDVASMTAALMDIEDVEAMIGRDFDDLDDDLLWRLYLEGIR